MFGGGQSDNNVESGSALQGRLTANAASRGHVSIKDELVKLTALSRVQRDSLYIDPLRRALGKRETMGIWV